MSSKVVVVVREGQSIGFSFITTHFVLSITDNQQKLAFRLKESNGTYLASAATFSPMTLVWGGLEDRPQVLSIWKNPKNPEDSSQLCLKCPKFSAEMLSKAAEPAAHSRAKSGFV